MFPPGAFFTRPQPGQPNGAAEPSDWALRNRLRVLTAADPRFDLATKEVRPITVTTGDFALLGNRHGRSFSQTGASSANSIGDLLWRNSWTALVIAAPLANTVMNVVATQQGAADRIAFGFNLDDQFNLSNGRFSVTLLQLQGGANRSHAYVSSATDGNWHAFLMRKRGSVVSAWIDGISKTVTTTGGMANAPGLVTDSIRLYGDSTNGSYGWQSGATISGFAYLQSALTDGECAELSRLENAWGMLLRPQELDFPAAAAAQTFSPAWARARNVMIGGAAR